MAKHYYYYECWAGASHPARNIPEGATDDTLLMFHCACMGSVEQASPVKEAIERGEVLTMADAMTLAQSWRPPRNPVVRLGDLQTENEPSAGL